MSVVTKEFLSYNLPLRGFDDHVEMVVGPGQAPQLHFYEAQNEQAANIHPGDFFVATDTINGYTRILEYSGIDSQHNELWLWDLAGSTTDKVPYNPITGTASHPIAGIPRRIVLSLQNVLAIDQDGNGIIDGKQSKIECIDRVISQEDLRPR